MSLREHVQCFVFLKVLIMSTSVIPITSHVFCFLAKHIQWWK